MRNKLIAGISAVAGTTANAVVSTAAAGVPAAVDVRLSLLMPDVPAIACVLDVAELLVSSPLQASLPLLASLLLRASLLLPKRLLVLTSLLLLECCCRPCYCWYPCLCGTSLPSYPPISTQWS